MEMLALNLAKFDVFGGIWIGLVVLVALVFLVLFAPVFKLWLQAIAGSAQIPMFELIGMRFRKVDPHTIVRNRIRAVQAGVEISAEQMERHYLVGGHVQDTVTAAITAHAAGVRVDWDDLAAIDLSGKDVIGHVRAAVDSGTPLPTGSERGEEEGEWDDFVGVESTAGSVIHPAGSVRIEGQSAAAVSEDGVIEQGAPIEIVDVITHVVVRKKQA